MEDMKLEYEELKRRWEDSHRQLARLKVAGDRTHVVVQRERKPAALQWLGARSAVRRLG